ncbi:hypothetical protein ACTEIW_000753 [Citrobacter freundii]
MDAANNPVTGERIHYSFQGENFEPVAVSTHMSHILVHIRKPVAPARVLTSKFNYGWQIVACPLDSTYCHWFFGELLYVC